jgi:hypothetical protein
MKSHRKDDMPPSLNRTTRMGAGGIAWDAVARLRLWLVAFTFATTAAGISDTGGFPDIGAARCRAVQLPANQDLTQCGR